ncbi:MAG: hypothetical protein M0Z38_02360 [Deltaproteobacteria bacterium]|nr:hypothetical protein [Deltaproteobacteria bacterium]
MQNKSVQDVGVRVPRKLAIAGFNLCASIFLGLCVYGLLVYSEGGKPPPGEYMTSILFGAAALVSIAGIGFFGSQWDRRNAEESREAKTSPLPDPGKPKKR